MTSKYPKYVKTVDGYIGTFVSLKSEEFPVYRFEGGDRVADRWELDHGSDRREDLFADTYKVTYRMFGDYFLYGYADTLEDAMILDETCSNEGWLHRKILHWDEKNMVWTEVNGLQESRSLHDRWADDDEPFRIVEGDKPNSKYFVKAPVTGWHNVDKDHFDRFVEHIRNNSNPTAITKDELVARVTKIVEEA